MGWLEGLVSGYADEQGQIRQEEARKAEAAAVREASVMKELLNSSDEKVRGMAATGLLASTQPKKRKGGFAGWMGEMESNPLYPQLMKYISTPQPVQVEHIEPGLPSRQTQGYLPAGPTSTSSLAQPETSPTEGAPMATPQPLPATVATPPPAPPGRDADASDEPVLTPEQVAMNFNASPNLTPPPRLTDEEAAMNLSNLPPAGAAAAPPQAAAPPAAVPAALAPTPPPAPPQGMLPGLQPTTTTQNVPGPAVGRRDVTTEMQLPHAFPTEGERQVELARGKEAGEYEALVDVGRRSGQPNPEKWAADLIAAGKARSASGLREGDSRQLPDGSWVQDLYDQNGIVRATIPAGPKGAGRQLGKRELIAQQLYGKEGVDPLGILSRLSPKQTAAVLDEERLQDAEAKLKAAELMADASLSSAAKSELIEKLNTKWTTLEKPQREMGRALGLMSVGVNRIDADPIGASQAVLITFQKILDPTSVVRESEYARSADGLPIVERIQGMYDRLRVGGAGVPKAELTQMAETARQFLAGMVAFNSTEHQRIELRARRNKIDPAEIFGPAPPPVPPPGGATTAMTPPPATRAPATAPAAGGTGLIMRNGVLSYPDGRPF